MMYRYIFDNLYFVGFIIISIIILKRITISIQLLPYSIDDISKKILKVKNDIIKAHQSLENQKIQYHMEFKQLKHIENIKQNIHQQKLKYITQIYHKNIIQNKIEELSNNYNVDKYFQEDLKNLKI